MIHIPGPYPPAIVHTVDGAFATAGNEPVKIPEDTPLDQLYSDYNTKPLTRHGSIEEACLWEVTGSTGKKYTVERDMRGTYSCTCLGYSYRKKCSHIERTRCNAS